MIKSHKGAFRITIVKLVARRKMRTVVNLKIATEKLKMLVLIPTIKNRINLSPKI